MMAWRRGTFGIVTCLALFAARIAERLPAADREPGATSSSSAKKNADSLSGRNSTAPRSATSAGSKERSGAESFFTDTKSALLSDDALAAWSDGPGNQLLGVEASALPQPPAPAGGDETDIDPWYGDFQRVAPGDEQPYWRMPDDDEPLGWIGEETVRPMDLSGSDFFPVPDRYRLGFPKWDRYVKGHPLDPYNQNVLKGDYPLCVGDNKFLELTGVSDSFIQARRKTIFARDAGGAIDPTATDIENDTQRRQRLFLTLDYFEDDNTFTPSPWFFRLTQVMEWRDQDDAVGYNDDYAWVEAFLDYRLAFLSDFGDQINLRVGRQAFQSDFRGFLYSDVNNMARLFGTWNENKWQYNFVVMDAALADKVSQFLQSNDDRHQLMVGGNVFRRDVPWLGFNVMGAGFYVHDDLKQTVDAGYLELAAEGVIGPYGISGAFIQALGHDAANPFAERSVDINAQFAALEVTRPNNWFTPRMSIAYASGDGSPKNGTARGFDAIFDNANFAGANFAYFTREQLQGRGNQITNFNSFLPSLRNRFFDPMNFVNPGIMVLTAGVDTTVTTTCNAFLNYNYYRFMEPAAIEEAIDVKGGGAVSIDREVGHDITLGLQYRPLVINNIVFNVGTTGFFQGSGFRDISGTNDVLFTHFANAVLVY